jgi:VCBS repeat protein
MLKYSLALSVSLSLFSSMAASAQNVSFTTTTYSQNNLWQPNGGPNAAIRADLNGDGREDFITDATASWANGCSITGHSFAVSLSNGDGTYAAPVCYELPTGFALYFAVGDFYELGILDLAVTNDQGDLYIYKNDGNGALTLVNSLTLNGEASGIVAADANHDGRIDLVYDVANNGTGGGGSLNVLFGEGNASFTAGPSTTFAMNGEPGGNLAVGDFDGDGVSDILVVGVTLFNAEVFYGNNTGNFSPGPIVGSTALQAQYQPFDVDTDGASDLIGSPTALNNGSLTPENYLDLEWGHYDRTLSSQKIPLQHCIISSNPPQVADFDGDSIADIIVAEDSDCQGDGPYTFNFMKGNGDGTFQAEQVIYSTGDVIAAWHVMRASHSSKPDLTVWQFENGEDNTILNPEELVLVNTTSGNFPACTPLNYRPFGINICGPTSMVGATSPVNFSFAASNQTPGRDMEIWIDGQKVDENLKNTYSNYSFIQDSIPLSAGEHEVDVFSVGWDYFLLLDQFPLYVGTDTCPVPSGFGVLACSPLGNSTLTSPVLAYAAGNVDSGETLVRMEVWVDGVKQYSTFGSNTLKTMLSLPPGWHQFAYFVVASDGGQASTIYYAAVQ